MWESKIRFPAGIFTAVDNVGPCQRETGLHLGGHHPAGGRCRAALARDDLYHALPVHSDSSQIGRSLDKARNVLAHRLDSVRTGEQSHYQLPGDIALNRFLGASIRLATDRDIRIRLEIFIPRSLPNPLSFLMVASTSGTAMIASHSLAIAFGLLPPFQHNKLKTVRLF